jgi:hypothetical protein
MEHSPCCQVDTRSVCEEILDIMEPVFFIWFVRLLALRPLLAYCASLG